MYMKIFAKGSTYVFETCDKVIIFFMLINLHLFIFYIEKKQQNMVTVVAPLMMTLNAVIITFLVENIKKYEQIVTNKYLLYILFIKEIFFYMTELDKIYFGVGT